jgi:hypothetical protein
MNLSINVIARNPEGTTKQSVEIAIALNGLLCRIELPPVVQFSSQ